jgi:hypothetical protein
MTVNGRKVLAASARAEAPNVTAQRGEMFLSVFLQRETMTSGTRKSQLQITQRLTSTDVRC